MDRLFKQQQALKERVLRSSFDMSARVFGSRFPYKIRRNLDMTVDQLAYGSAGAEHGAGSGLRTLVLARDPRQLNHNNSGARNIPEHAH